MPLEISSGDLEKIWVDQEPWREDMTKRQDYYDGKHAILGRNETYVDGSPKSELVANWIEYIVDLYVGLMTATPYQITAKDEEANPEGIQSYTEVSEANALPAQDVENLRTALIQGHSIELHEFDKDIIISQHDPRNWALIYDEKGNLSGAILRVKLAAGTSRDGVLLANDTELMVFYDDTNITTFERVGDTSGWTQIGEPVAHEFGQVPVVVWAVNKKMKTVISNALIGQQDDYNDIHSAASDDIRRAVDSLLKLSGFGADAKELAAALVIMRDEKVIPLPENGEADYITQTQDVDPSEAHLTRTREVIHVMGPVPDFQQIAGATGITTGIALRLKFLPMLQQAASMRNYIEAGMRQRIDLINTRLGPQENPVIEDYRVVIQFALPANRVEEWKSIGALDGIVSHLTQLELLSDIDNPEEELARIEEEGVGVSEDLTPEQVREQQDAEVARVAMEVGPQVQVIMEALSATVLDTITRSGVLDRTAARAQREGENGQ